MSKGTLRTPCTIGLGKVGEYIHTPVCPNTNKVYCGVTYSTSVQRRVCVPNNTYTCVY